MLSNCILPHCTVVQLYSTTLLACIGLEQSIVRFKEPACNCWAANTEGGVPRGIDGISQPARSNKILRISEKSRAAQKLKSLYARMLEWKYKPTNWGFTDW